ncbi:ParB/RepB/Spo0J family partition protein (plasmid) [Streptomyces seoulensis]|nr:ParB/RepB/Spo0J family partition protein [Streptomyces seoulensis]
MAATKKKAWTDLLGAAGPTSDSGAQEPDAPAEPPTTVYMHTIVGNPANPRPEEDYTDDDPEFRELKASMKEIGQLQPLAVVSRHVFEQAKADSLAQAPAKTRQLIHEADWVVVTGNRRLAAARQLGWTRIDIRVQDQLGDEDGRIDEAVIIENIHRKNLAPIKEAEYLAGMLERHGSQEKVAARIGKSQVYVSQRLALLKLAPDIQQEVDAGTLKIKEARRLAGQTTDHDEQRARVAELRVKSVQSKPPQAREEGPAQNPVLKPFPESVATRPDTATRESAAAGLPQVQNRVLKSRPSAPSDPEYRDGIPEPREAPAPAATDPVDPSTPKRFPYEDGTLAAQHLIRKMPDGEFNKMIDMCLEHRSKQSATAV